MKRHAIPGILLLPTALLLGCSEQGVGPTDLPQTAQATNGTLGSTGQSSAARTDARNFAAPLSGSQEAPPVETKGTGVAKFKLSKDGGELSFKLNVAHIDNVTQSHIHLGARGTNGPVVVFLFGFVPGGATVNE